MNGELTDEEVGRLGQLFAGKIKEFALTLEHPLDNGVREIRFRRPVFKDFYEIEGAGEDNDKGISFGLWAGVAKSCCIDAPKLVDELSFLDGARVMKFVSFFTRLSRETGA